MSRKNLFYRRRFLNRRGRNAGAYIIAEVSTSHSKTKKGDDYFNISAGLTIADCNRIVGLEFDVWGEDGASSFERDLDNVLYKARNLRQVVNGFVDALEQAVDELEGDA